MGVVAAKEALREACITEPEAILLGTGLGCIEDTEKFLNTIISNNEEYISPSAFIESTHNTVGARIALGMNCNSYNTTYVHGSASFESALIDAQLMVCLENKKNVLVGGVDELGKEFINYVSMLEASEKQGITVPFGEGASFFILSSEASKEGIELIAVELNEVIPEVAIAKKTEAFLNRNGLSSNDVDAFISGHNGDAFDRYYQTLANSLFAEVPQLSYKHLSGEHYTTSGFGLWAGYRILKEQHIPQALNTGKAPQSPVKTVLLYNQFKGKSHSFILLSQC